MCLLLRRWAWVSYVKWFTKQHMASYASKLGPSHKPSDLKPSICSIKLCSPLVIGPVCPYPQNCMQSYMHAIRELLGDTCKPLQLGLTKWNIGWTLWLLLAIPPTWETELGRIMIQGQPEQNVRQTLISTSKPGSGTCLWSQLYRRHRSKDCSPRPAQEKLKAPSEK
jgi:hypothetical protein